MEHTQMAEAHEDLANLPHEVFVADETIFEGEEVNPAEAAPAEATPPADVTVH